MKLCKKYENWIGTLAFMAVNIILLGVCFDFYYDLNDDTMMKDIMSGVYSGTPDGHNMQTLYVLGAFISLCYRLCGEIPWYGLFLCLCQFGCLYLIGVRLAGFFEKSLGKWVALTAYSAFLWSVCLPHLVNLQYTVTCALLSATAIFWFVTTPEKLAAKQFVVKNIPAITLVILAYQLRTEMLLLTMPFVGLAGLYRLLDEKKVFTKENLVKYGMVLGITLAGMALSGSVDYIAYGSVEWSDFRNFFKARTTIYDFYPEVVTQHDYSGDLEQLGVEGYQQLLLRNYNFGLDKTLDTKLLATVAEYAENTVGAARDWTGIVKEKLGDYRYRLLHSGDAPYNVMTLWAYVMVSFAGVYRRTVCKKQDDGVLLNKRQEADGKMKWAFVWKPALLFVVRTLIWMFIMVRGREPERITHSLYLVEFTLLTGLFLHDTKTVGSLRRNGAAVPQLMLLRGMAVLFILLTVGTLFKTVPGQFLEKRQREAVNVDRYAIEEYCRRHEENFYFEDVYSTVGFSQKIFEDNSARPANYDIMGGWICKSPLYYEKLAYFDMSSMADSLAGMEKAFLVMSDTELKEQGFEWLTAYYTARGRQVSVVQADRINEEYGVYKVICNSPAIQ